MARIRSTLAAATLVVVSLVAPAIALAPPTQAHVSQSRATQGPGDFGYIYGDNGDGLVWDGECDGHAVEVGIHIDGVGEFFTRDKNGCKQGGTEINYADDQADDIRVREWQPATFWTPGHWAYGAAVHVHKHPGSARLRR